MFPNIAIDCIHWNIITLSTSKSYFQSNIYSKLHRYFKITEHP